MNDSVLRPGEDPDGEGRVSRGAFCAESGLLSCPQLLCHCRLGSGKVKQGTVKEANSSAVCSQSNLRLVLGIFRRQICSIGKFIYGHESWSFSDTVLTVLISLEPWETCHGRRWLAEHLEELQEEREKGLGTPVTARRVQLMDSKVKRPLSNLEPIHPYPTILCSHSVSHCFKTRRSWPGFDMFRQFEASSTFGARSLGLRAAAVWIPVSLMFEPR